MKEAAGTLLLTKDGSVVLQRRTSDAPTSPDMLAVFGGLMEGDESPIDGARRELSEEISLDVSSLTLSPLVDFTHEEKRLHLFLTIIPNTEFQVYEGVGAEVYTIKQALGREDLTYYARRAIEAWLTKEN